MNITAAILTTNGPENYYIDGATGEYCGNDREGAPILYVDRLGII